MFRLDVKLVILAELLRFMAERKGFSGTEISESHGRIFENLSEICTLEPNMEVDSVLKLSMRHGIKNII